MDIVYAVALLGLAVVLFVVFMLLDRAPDSSGWTSDGMLSELSTVAITGLFAFGLCFGVRFFASAGGLTIGVKEVALLAAILTAYYLIYRKLAPRRRLAEYAEQRAQGSAMKELSPVSVLTPASPAVHGGPSGNPDLPRAA